MYSETRRVGKTGFFSLTGLDNDALRRRQDVILELNLIGTDLFHVFNCRDRSENTDQKTNTQQMKGIRRRKPASGLQAFCGRWHEPIHAEQHRQRQKHT